MSPRIPEDSRYHPLSAHYRRRFGCRVYKVSVSVAQTCPNRTSPVMSVCVFCDEWGSAAYPQHARRSLAEQIRINGEHMRRRFKADKLLVYFQAYTNTFTRQRELERMIETALAQPHVAGIILGTRPDCLPPRVWRLLDEVSHQAYVSVELGVQTLDDEQLVFLSRGHDAASSLRALEQLGAHERIDGCAHLMFGIPGETPRQLRETAHTLSALGVNGVKLHNLHVLRGTPLADMHAAGTFTPVTLDAYADKVITFLEYLDPAVPVHRLNAVASRWDEVVAPPWACKKMEPTMFIIQRMAERETWQGRLYAPPASRRVG